MPCIRRDIRREKRKRERDDGDALPPAGSRGDVELLFFFCCCSKYDPDSLLFFFFLFADVGCCHQHHWSSYRAAKKDQYPFKLIAPDTVWLTSTSAHPVLGFLLFLLSYAVYDERVGRALFYAVSQGARIPPSRSELGHPAMEDKETGGRPFRDPENSRKDNESLLYRQQQKQRCSLFLTMRNQVERYMGQGRVFPRRLAILW